MPQTFEGLESLAGVGHKTASVVMMQAFKKPAFPVDTHIHRLACRWGCGDAKSVEKTEAMLKRWFPDPSTWGELHVRIILFGREFCPARKHDMDLCPICSFAATEESRRANDINVNKFVAAVKHSNPYSVRDAPPMSIVREIQENVNEEYKLVKSKRSRKRKNNGGENENLLGEEGEEDDAGAKQLGQPTRRRTSVSKSVKTRVESKATGTEQEIQEEIKTKAIDAAYAKDTKNSEKMAATRRSQRLLTKKTRMLSGVTAKDSNDK